MSVFDGQETAVPFISGGVVAEMTSMRKPVAITRHLVRRRRRPIPTMAAGFVAILAGLVVAAPTNATPTGRNGLIAFSADVGHGTQIYTVDSRGQHLRKLTQLAGDAWLPHWSPDGRLIAFELDQPGGTCSIELMHADGSGRTSLTPRSPEQCDAWPTFTPDGKRIVFVHVSGLGGCFNCSLPGQAIWSMNLAGGDRRRITAANGSGVAVPEVSPDGRTLAYTAWPKAPSDLGPALFTSSMDGSHVHRLTSYRAGVQFKFDWAPDGRQLAFSAHSAASGDSVNLATIDPDGSDLTWLTSYSGGAGNANVGSYSPDGRWIVYRAEQDGQFCLCALSVDGTTQREILGFSSFRPRGIAWGPAVH
jgi:Tol biopolymer transport system component